MKLSEYKAFLSLTFDQFIEQNNIAPGQVKENLAYQKIKDVTRVDYAEGQAFFFKEGKLQIIYMSASEAANDLWQQFQHETNVDKPDETVRSRAGKTSKQLIFAGQGVAVSLTKDEVDFMEVFPARSLKEYHDTIYVEPGRFIR